MTVRKAFFWLHLAAGCVAGSIVLVMSITGVLLTYERQILAWSDRGGLRADPPPGAPRLAASGIVEAVKKQQGEIAPNASLTVRSDPREPVEIRAGRESLLYVNAYTGSVLEGGRPGTRIFFQKMVAWHRWLGVEGEGRETSKAITGACNLAFLFLIVSGAYLWLPRQWSRQSVRPIAWFRSGLAGKARDFNWHNVFGIWALVPLFFVVLTALPISYRWASDAVYRMTGSEPPAQPAGKGDGKAARKGPANRGRPGGRPRAAVPEGIDALWDRAAGHVPGWKSITAVLAVAPGEPVSFAINTGDGGQPQKRSTLVLDASTGAVVRYETFGDGSAGRKLRMWSRFVHTGEYYGVVGQTVAGVASAAGVMLVWTGVSLSLRRFASWNGRRRKRRGLREEEPAAVLD